MYLNGNSSTYSGTLTCTLPGIGRCEVFESGRGTVNGETATVEADGVISCPGIGNVAVAVTWHGAKQHTVLLSNAGRDEAQARLAGTLTRAAGI